MKKKILVLSLCIALLLCLLPTFAAAEEYVTVTFDANGGHFWRETITIDTEDAPKGGTSTVLGQGPGVPKRDGYEFIGWSLSSDGSGEIFSFDYPFGGYTPTYQSDTTFYAMWKIWEPTGTCGDDLTWSFDAATGKLTITGSGVMEDYDWNNLPPWYSVRSQITSISLPNDLTTIGELAFMSCTALTSVPLPKGLTSIGAAAFHSCGALTSITFPDTLQSIGTEAFMFSGLTSVTIPRSVTEMWGHPFAACDDLTVIEVSSENADFTSDQGVLFTKDKTHLMTFPAGHAATNYSIPTTVTDVEECAFRHVKLTSVNVPDSVTTIGWLAFDNSTRLSSLTLGKGIQSISDCAFSGCRSLTNIYYQGTEAQSKEIEIGNENDPLLNAIWQYDSQGPAITPTPESTPTPKTSKGMTMVTEPKDATIRNKAKATFTVKVSGSKLTYQWYYRKNATAKWAKVKGATKAKLSVTGSTSNSGYQYYCVIKNGKGMLKSDVATLTVELFPPEIVSEPEDVEVKSGEKATFAVSATGDGLTYQWYYKKSASATKWTKVSKATKATYSVKGTIANDGYQYRCLVKNADGKEYTDPVTLDVDYHLPTITAQPTIPKSVKKNASVILEVGAENYYEADLTYQWYSRKSSSAKWTKIKKATEPTYTFKATTKLNGYQYKCDVTNVDGTVSTKTLKLKVK